MEKSVKESVNGVSNVPAVAASAEEWATPTATETKTALSKAKGELLRELQSPFAVCNAIRAIAKDKTTAVAQVLAALEIKPRELSPRSFGRFCLQTEQGLSIGREVSAKQLARLRNAKSVSGFKADGTPTTYVTCEMKPAAYISALFALAKDKGISFDKDGKRLAAKAKAAKQSEKSK